MLLDDKRLLITGVLDPRSIAFHVARTAQREGAEVVLSSFGRARRLTERTAKRLDPEPDVLELDVTSTQDIEAVAAELADRWGALDGLLHAVAFAPDSCLGGGFLEAPFEDVSTAVHISAYSLAALGRGLRELLAAGGTEAAGASIVGLDFDASRAWPVYDWMGVAKAGLEATTRYVARELGPDGVRANLVAAGPLNTQAARSIEGFAELAEVWPERAPLGWDLDDPTATVRAVCMLLSDWSAGVTGEIVHADGGAHAMGA